MKKNRPPNPEQCAEAEELRAQLMEARETLQAIRNGEVDGLVVAGPQGDRIYALEGAETPYRILVEAMREGALTVTDDGTILFCNKRFAQMVAIPLERVVGSSIFAYVDSERADDLRALLSLVINEEGKQELPLIRPDGSRVPAYLSVSGLPGIGARPLLCIVATDLTEQKHHEQLAAAEASLRRNQELLEEALRCEQDRRQELEAVLNAVPVPVWITHDPQARIIKGNRAAYTLLRLPEGVNTSHDGPLAERPTHFRLMSNGKSLTSAELPIQRGARGEVLRDVEFDLVFDDGAHHTMLGNVQPVMDERGRSRGAVGAFMDITDRKRGEERLNLLNATLENRVARRTAEAEQRSAQLRALAKELTQVEQRERRQLAHVLHDNIQQLLAASKMHLSLVAGRLADKGLGQEIRKVDDLLGQSIDACRSLTVELSPILYDTDLATALVWLSRRMLDKHNLAVDVEADPAAEPKAEDVRVMLFTAVKELLFNVVKHAGVQRVRVVTTRQEGNIEVLVEDRGAGFDLTILNSNQGPGSGFGLFSIQHRLELAGGRFSVESSPGHGTRVRLRAPLSEAGGKPPSPVAAEPPAKELPPAAQRRQLAAGKKIGVLLADDHQLLREGLISIIQTQPDIQVIGQAKDGREAVDLARDLRPDLVIMDISMPRLNGIEATRIITAELPDVKVLGLSMHEEKDAVDTMLHAGARNCLRKDGPSAALLVAIRECCPSLSQH